MGGEGLTWLATLPFIFLASFSLPNPLYLFPIILPDGPSIHRLWWLQMVVDVEEEVMVAA
jgi:hypothetical protein